MTTPEETGLALAVPIPPSIAAVNDEPALALLDRAVLQLADMAATYRGDPYATGTAVVHIDRLLRDLRSIQHDLKRWTSEAMTAKELAIPGIGIIAKAGEGSSDVWDDIRTMTAILNWGQQTGVLNGPKDVAALVLTFARIDYWLKTKLREAGIRYTPERDENGDIIEGTGLVTTTYGEPSVRVVAT